MKQQLLSVYLDSYKRKSRMDMIEDVSARWDVSRRTVFNWVKEDATIEGRKGKQIIRIGRALEEVLAKEGEG